MKKLLIVLCLLAQPGLPQSVKIDSLKRVLSGLHKQADGYSRDTLIYNTMKAVMRAYTNENVDSSMYYNSLLINFCKDAILQKELIYAYQYTGYLYQIKGNHYRSIEFHYKALLLAEKLAQYTRMAVSHGALAHAYSSLKEYDKAATLCRQGLVVLRKYPDVHCQLSILNVLGVIYREQGKLVDALKTNQDLYQLAQSSREQWYESHGLHAVGLVYKAMGRLDSAINHYERALVLARQTGSVELEGNILLNITDLYILQKKWRSALRFCSLAHKTAVRVKNSSIVAESNEKFYTIFRQTGEPVKALKAYEKFVFLRDSLSQEKTQQRIEALRAQYDNEQKTNALQKERMNRLAAQNQNQQLSNTRNALFFGIVAILIVVALLFWSNRKLQAKNTEINRQRVLLETAWGQLADINKTLENRVAERTDELVRANWELTQKNEEINKALFRGQTIERKRVALELHDNLSSLLSAVNMSMQAINPQHLSESEQSVYRNVKQLIQNAYTEVRNISHNILPAELEREGLVKTLSRLINQLSQTSSIRFTLSVMDLSVRLPAQIEFNVYSIVLELINNAIRHAKAASVTICLSRISDRIDLLVTDDGVGLGQQNEKRGIGLQNIQTRLESLGGTFTAIRPDEKGTRINIKIPIETALVNGNLATI